MKKDKMKEVLSKKLKDGSTEFTAREVLLIKEMILNDELDKYSLEIKDMDIFTSCIKESIKNEHKYTNRKVDSIEFIKFIILLIIGIYMGVVLVKILIKFNSIDNVRSTYLWLLLLEILLAKILKEVNLDIKIPDLQNKKYNTIYKITNIYWKVLTYINFPVIAYIIIYARPTQG